MSENNFENERRVIVGESMVLKSYYMPKIYDKWLKEEAKRRSISTAQLIRDIVKAEMRSQVDE